MLDHIKAEAYGDRVPLNTLATILARDAQLLVANVYDPSVSNTVYHFLTADTSRGVDERWMGWQPVGLGIAWCEVVLWSAIQGADAGSVTSH